MKYRSTRGGTPTVSFEEALFSGVLPDGGLYVPVSVPVISTTTLQSWRDLSYQNVAVKILRYFITEEELSTPKLEAIVDCAFARFDTSSPVIIHPLERNVYIGELFHGPTMAFKDLALGIVGHLLAHFLDEKQCHAVVMVGTAGDTGSSAIESVRHIDQIDIVVLYPKGRCTRFQELQMITAISKNIHCFAVEGTSDDIDAAIGKCFEDTDFVRANNILSVNSINIARILIQMAHFFFIYLKLASDLNQTVEFVIPTGACGHLTAALLASKMGLPIKIVTAVNANDTVYHTINNGMFSSSNDVTQTLATAMDIQVPYNMERILYYLTDGSSSTVKSWMEEYDRMQNLRLPTDVVEKLQATFTAFKADDGAIIQATQRCWKESQYLICPQTATAFAFHYSDDGRKLNHCRVILATASPAKFPESLIAAGLQPLTCPALYSLCQRETRFGMMKKSEDWVAILKQTINDISKRVSSTRK